jgi:peroxiredoxin
MAFWNSRKMLAVGETAPDFELKDVKGALLSSKELLGKAPALFALFKVSCPVCQYTFPFLERVHRGVAAERLQVVGISQDDAGSTRSFNQECGLSFPVLLDTTRPGYPVSNRFGISTVPCLFLVEKDGRVSWTSTGFSKADLEDLGATLGCPVFQQDEDVPAWKAG